MAGSDTPSATTRIVLLLDLHPLAGAADPNPFVAAVLAAARPILAAPFLSSSLFTFRFFFSDLSPLQSSSRTHALLARSPILPFSLGPQTLADLSDALDLAASRAVESGAAPRAAFVASSLCQILHDYLWDPPAHHSKGMDPPLVAVRSNLVLFFSNFAQSLLQLSEFMNCEFDDVKSFCDSFSRVFNAPKMGFSSRDVHLSWVDVGLDRDQFDRGLAYLEKGIRSLGWGVCSTDAISLGSAVVPFGLIYPNIATSVGCKVDSCAAELILEILDVSGKPLECKCCDLEILRYSRPVSGECFLGDGIKKVSIMEIHRNDKTDLKDICAGELFLIRGSSNDSKIGRAENCAFVVDKVLEMLRTEVTEFRAGHPSWPIFLNFLYREGFVAKVSISNGDEVPITGIIVPFTVHSAVLCVLNDESTNEVAVETKQVFSCSGALDLLCFLNSCRVKALEHKTERKKCIKKKTYRLSNTTWVSFREGIRGYSSVPKHDDMGLDLDLEEVYFSSNLKKLRFLKCWMKQSKNLHFKEKPVKTQVNAAREDIEDEAATDNSIEESSSASNLSKEKNVGETTDAIKPSFSFVETSEDFHRSLDEKIQRGLDSEKLDLVLVAECMVESCINWLYAKSEKDMPENSNAEHFVGEHSTIAAELVNILLRKPRDLTAKYKGSISTISKVREHEMQILFRMEILQSKLGSCLDEVVKEKIVKDICSLLANIEFNLDGGVFGGESLVEFAGRIMRKRYSQSCSNVIRKIYEKMEFIWSSEVEEKEASDSWHNSTDEGKESGGIHRRSEEERSSDMDVYDLEGGAGDQRLGQSRVIEARKKREMARKLAASTSWAPNLERVWAFKQTKQKMASRSVMEVDKKECRRRRRSSFGDVVCETPMLRSKRVESGESCRRQADCKEGKSSLACKALFQDSD